MEWNDESISRLRSLWQEGLSTAEIGRRMQITKNAVVGKAHRLILSPRPSPIRKGLEAADGSEQPGRPVAAAETSRQPMISDILPSTDMQLDDQHVDPIQVPTVSIDTVREPADAPVPVAPVREAATVHQLRPIVSPVPPRVVASVERVAPIMPRLAPVAPIEAEETVRGHTPSTPRRRGLACCWPLGDPGTKEFRFCGADPVASKPYCSEHAALAYVKLRDRRDSSVA
ncbi:MAG: GcrA family cell cycle regulator [Janthinobacterium lividum]